MSQERATGTTDGVERLRGELRDTVDLIRRSGGGVVFEMFPGALQEESGAAGRLDASAAAAGPDAHAAACHALIDEANELAETLARLDKTAWSLQPLPTRPVSS